MGLLDFIKGSQPKQNPTATAVPPQGTQNTGLPPGQVLNDQTTDLVNQQFGTYNTGPRPTGQAATDPNLLQPGSQMQTDPMHQQQIDPNQPVGQAPMDQIQPNQELDQAPTDFSVTTGQMNPGTAVDLTESVSDPVQQQPVEPADPISAMPASVPGVDTGSEIQMNKGDQNVDLYGNPIQQPEPTDSSLATVATPDVNLDMPGVGDDAAKIDTLDAGIPITDSTSPAANEPKSMEQLEQELSAPLSTLDTVVEQQNVDTAGSQSDGTPKPDSTGENLLDLTPGGTAAPATDPAAVSEVEVIDTPAPMSDSDSGSATSVIESVASSAQENINSTSLEDILNEAPEPQKTDGSATADTAPTSMTQTDPNTVEPTSRTQPEAADQSLQAGIDSRNQVAGIKDNSSDTNNTAQSPAAAETQTAEPVAESPVAQSTEDQNQKINNIQFDTPSAPAVAATNTPPKASENEPSGVSQEGNMSIPAPLTQLSIPEPHEENKDLEHAANQTIKTPEQDIEKAEAGGQIFQKIALLGLDGPKVDLNLSSTIERLVGEMAKENKELVIDSKKSLGGVALDIAEKQNTEVKGVYLRPYMSGEFSSEENLSESKSSSVIFSNYIERLKYIVKESDLFILFDSGGLHNNVFLSTIVALGGMYEGQNKPVILFGDTWENHIAKFSELNGSNGKIMDLVKIVKTVDDLLDALKQLEDEYSKKEKFHFEEVDDRRVEGDERDFIVS